MTTKKRKLCASCLKFDLVILPSVLAVVLLPISSGAMRNVTVIAKKKRNFSLE